MPTDSKLQDFLAAVYDDAAQAGSVYTDAVKARREAFLTAAEDEILAEVYAYIRSKTARIRTDAGRAVSECMSQLKRELYNLRTDIADQVADSVRGKVVEYTASPAYPSALDKIALRAMREIAGDELEIYLRPDDMKYADHIAALTGATVKQGRFSLGGLIAQNPARHLRLDLTYDAAMDALPERFAVLSDFSFSNDNPPDGGGE